MKRYTMKGYTGQTIRLHLVLKNRRKLWFGILINVGRTSWDLVLHEEKYLSTLTRVRARITLEGLGLKGPLISINGTEAGMLGELVMNEITGSSSIEFDPNTSFIWRTRNRTPLDCRDQAVQLFASNWISFERGRSR